MKKKLTANLGLKILAVLFSVAIWFIVININDPVDKAEFTKIPVEILNEDLITSEGKVYEILDGTNVIDVTVWAKRSVLDTLSRENIIATADMQEINLMDTMVRIKLSTNKYNEKLDNITSSTENLLVSIEDMKREQFVIEASTIGVPAEGYVVGSISTDQNLVSLTGPESVVSQVDRVEVPVTVSGVSQDIRTDATIKLFDAEGNPVSDKNLKKSLEQVKVNIEILQTKRVPLSFASTGEPAEGYALTGVIESTPSTVLIAGKGNVIKNVTQIDIPDSALNVNGYAGNMTTRIDLKKYLPDYVYLAEKDFNGKVNVMVHIEKEISSQVSLAVENIPLRGVPVGMEGSLAEAAVSVPVKGLSNYIENLNSADITAYVDIAEFMSSNGFAALLPGEYEMNLSVKLPEGTSQEREVPVTVVITDETIEEKEEE